MTNSKSHPFRNSALPLDERVADLISKLTLEEKISLLECRNKGVARLGIPRLNFNNEALHGVIRPGPATVFPQAIALAATWDPQLIRRVATAISDEARAKQNSMDESILYRFGCCYAFFSPVVNMARDPRWGRTQETYGEDPCLTAAIGAAFVRGMQGDHPVYLKAVAAPKHFAMNNEEHNRFECNARVSEKTLREYYLPGFKACVMEGKAASAMASYNAINGTPCHASPRLLTDILRNEWRFDGFVVSDAGGISRLYDSHHAAPSPEEAAAMALKAGIDLALGSGAEYASGLPKALEQNLIDVSLLDRALKHLLGVWFRLGLFDPPKDVPYTAIPAEKTGCAAHVELALKTTCSSMVLLKNAPLAGGRPLLPLDRSKIKSLALIGNNADRCVFGHYSGKSVHPPVSALDGIRALAGDGINVRHVNWRYRHAGRFVVMESDEIFPAGGAAGTNGFYGEYFTNAELKGKPAFIREDTAINFHWQWLMDPCVPGEKYSIRWTAVLKPRVPGIYQFRALFGAGAKVYLDDELIVNQWADDVHVNQSCSVPLEAGRAYRLRIEHYSVRMDRRYASFQWAPPVDAEANAFSREIKAAAESDVVAAVIGLDTLYECEGLDRKELELPTEQIEMIQKVLVVNPRVVVVIESGSSAAVPWLHEHAPAILEAWYPGEQGGRAVAQTIFGENNPGGRLPLTFYRATSDLPAFDDYELIGGRTYRYAHNPLYAFGHGLSYTTFKHSSFAARTNAKAMISFSVDVKNSGARDGDEVVQIYLRGPDGRDDKRLVAFARIHLKAGETRRVKGNVETKWLETFDEASGSMRIQPGRYEIAAGSSSDNISATQNIILPAL